MDIQPFLAALPVFLYVCFGLAYGFFGYRFIKLMLIGLGCFAGLALAALAAHRFAPGQPSVFIAACLAGPLAGALLFALVYTLAIFAAGFGVGALFAPLPIAALLADRPLISVLAVLAIGIGGGLLAVKFEQELMMLFSAALGAVVVVVSLHLLLAIDTASAVDLEAVTAAYRQAFAVTWWLIAGLLAAGFFFQWRRRPARQAR